MQRDQATEARLQRVAEIEARIDPERRRRGRLIADLVTLAIVAPVAIALDFHVTRPFVMLALMAGALGLNHLVPVVTERRLRRERNRLLGGSEAPGPQRDRLPPRAPPPST